jgi:hypothetical protein
VANKTISERLPFRGRHEQHGPTFSAVVTVNGSLPPGSRWDTELSRHLF